MAWWSIGPIVGQYQPEDFTEKQSADYAQPETFGTVSPLIFRKWSPREVTLSFVVNAMVAPGEETARNDLIPNAVAQHDPEVVWATIMAMMRPGLRTVSPPPPILGGTNKRDYPRVTIPGWGVSDFTPNRAVIVDAVFKRTHILGNPPRCVRGIITVTLREIRGVVGGTVGTEAVAAGLKAGGFVD